MRAARFDVRTGAPVKLVPLKATVQLLGGTKAVGLVEADFESRPATAAQLLALNNFRVAAPVKLPIRVASKIIAGLAKRANDSRNLAVLWQLHKLVYEYHYDAVHVLTLSYDAAMRAIDGEQFRQSS